MSNTHENQVKLSLFAESKNQFINIYVKNYSKKDKEWLKKNKIYFDEDKKEIEIIIANHVNNNSIVFDVLKYFVLRMAV